MTDKRHECECGHAKLRCESDVWPGVRYRVICEHCMTWGPWCECEEDAWDAWDERVPVPCSW